MILKLYNLRCYLFEYEFNVAFCHCKERGNIYRGMFKEQINTQKTEFNNNKKTLVVKITNSEKL
jgi:hypothetical protein